VARIFFQAICSVVLCSHAAWAAAADAWPDPMSACSPDTAGQRRATEPFDGNFGFFYNFTGNPYSFHVDGASPAQPPDTIGRGHDSHRYRG